MHHAWCVDRQTGKVVDTTWRKANKQTEYFGVPFTLSAVEKYRTSSGYTSIIDNWHEHWPLLSLTKEQLVAQKIVEVL